MAFFKWSVFLKISTACFSDGVSRFCGWDSSKYSNTHTNKRILYTTSELGIDVQNWIANLLRLQKIKQMEKWYLLKLTSFWRHWGYNVAREIIWESADENIIKTCYSKTYIMHISNLKNLANHFLNTLCQQIITW